MHYAIADVAAFVRPGGAVDVEAHRRGETLYGVGSKVPLHPPVISEQACSLLPDGDRPALLWTIDVDDAGEGTEVRVERALVRSRAKLSYAGVQADLDAGRADPVFALLREVGSCARSGSGTAAGSACRCPTRRWCETGRWRLGSGRRCRSRGGTRRSRCSPGWRPRT